MLRWGKARPDPSAGAAADRPLRSVDPAPADPVYEAMDAIAALLRALGRYGFDLEQETAETFEQACEAWARHILVAAPAPRATPEDRPESPTQRDWIGLQRFVVSRRSAEQAYVGKAISDLRQVVWTFVQGLQRTFAEELEANDRLLERLRDLEAVDGRSTEEIKREVVQAVAALIEVIEERKRRQETRLHELGEQVRTLGSQLTAAKQESTTDELTRVFNRRALAEYLGKMVSLQQAFGQTACMIVVDLDHFNSSFR